MQRTIAVASGGRKYIENITVGPHTLQVDEPVALGGGDSAPTPYELLLGALGACTAITVRMFAERLGHFLHNAPGKIPINVAVETNRPAGAFVFGNAFLVERQNFRMFFRKPDGRRGGGRGEYHLNAVFAHHIHDAFEPAEVVFPLLAFAKAPGKIANANHIDADFAH